MDSYFTVKRSQQLSETIDVLRQYGAEYRKWYPISRDQTWLRAALSAGPVVQSDHSLSQARRRQRWRSLVFGNYYSARHGFLHRYTDYVG